MLTPKVQEPYVHRGVVTLRELAIAGPGQITVSSYSACSSADPDVVAVESQLGDDGYPNEKVDCMKPAVQVSVGGTAIYVSFISELNPPQAGYTCRYEIYYNNNGTNVTPGVEVDSPEASCN
jgi:hypothetical protein